MQGARVYIPRAWRIARRPAGANGVLVGRAGRRDTNSRTTTLLRAVLAGLPPSLSPCRMARPLRDASRHTACSPAESGRWRVVGNRGPARSPHRGSSDPLAVPPLPAYGRRAMVRRVCARRMAVRFSHFLLLRRQPAGQQPRPTIPTPTNRNPELDRCPGPENPLLFSAPTPRPPSTRNRMCPFPITHALQIWFHCPPEFSTHLGISGTLVERMGPRGSDRPRAPPLARPRPPRPLRVRPSLLVPRRPHAAAPSLSFRRAPAASPPPLPRAGTRSAGASCPASRVRSRLSRVLW